MNKEQFITYLQDTDGLDSESLEGIKRLTVEYPWFQAAWALYIKNLKNVNAPEYNSKLKQVAVKVPDRKNLFKFLNSELVKQKSGIEKLKAASSLYQLESGDESLEGNPLIDRFLKSNNGSIVKAGTVDEKNVSTDDKAFINKSVAENDELVTETLAAIYFQQKNYEKAQKAYQKLSLKYPEKSVYFAARIKEIEVLKKNN